MYVHKDIEPNVNEVLTKFAQQHPRMLFLLIFIDFRPTAWKSFIYTPVYYSVSNSCSILSPS